MTIDEAKAILQTCRLEAADGDDVRTQEALAMLENNQELSEWFAAELLFDSHFGEKLSGIQPPAGLKEKLLALAPAEQTLDEPIPFPTTKQHWWQSPKIISAAASIVIIFVFGSMILDPQPLAAADNDIDYPDFYREVADKSKMLPKLQIKSSDLDKNREFLSSAGAPVPGQLPAKIDPLTEVGSTTFVWHDVPVSIIHMHEGRDFYLYIIELNAFGDDDIPPVGEVMHKVGDIALMVWADDAHLYVMSIVGSTDSLADMRE